MGDRSLARDFVFFICSYPHSPICLPFSHHYVFIEKWLLFYGFFTPSSCHNVMIHKGNNGLCSVTMLKIGHPISNLGPSGIILTYRAAHCWRYGELWWGCIKNLCPGFRRPYDGAKSPLSYLSHFLIRRRVAKDLICHPQSLVRKYTGWQQLCLYWDATWKLINQDRRSDPLWNTGQEIKLEQTRERWTRTN